MEEKTVKLMSIGEALQATRWFFLKECNNPLGLAYGLYSPAHYQVAQSPEPTANYHQNGTDSIGKVVNG